MGQATKPPKDGTMPVSVLHQVSEHAVGGFALFYFNSENGFPQQIMGFDTPAHCLAMQKFMTDWCNALQAVYLEGNKANIKGQFPNQES